MIALLALALNLVQLTGPDGQLIIVNPDQVVSLRVPRGETSFPPGVHCLLHMTDGKYVTVQQTCDQAREILQLMLEQQP